MRHPFISLSSAILAITLSFSCNAELLPENNTTVTGIFTGATFSTLDAETNSVYFPQGTLIVEIDPATSATNHINILPPDTFDVSALTRNSATVQMAYSSSFGFDVPYTYSVFDGTTTTNIFVLNNIFDACTAPDGGRYIVANPGNMGSRIFHFSGTETTLVANIGGPSGGIACDADGTLYYAYQAPDYVHGSIVFFTPEQCATGGLTYADAHVLNTVKASSLCIGADGFLYASVPTRSSLHRYDLMTGNHLGTFASDPSNDWQLGKLSATAETNIYASYTDWTAFQGTLYKITMPGMPGFIGINGAVVNNVYSSDGTYTTLEGLCAESNSLYFGNLTAVKKADMFSGTITNAGTLPSNAGIAFVQRKNGITYTAYGTSYSLPYPYKLGYIGTDSLYTNVLDEDGIFDAAVNSRGEMYIVANPDAAGAKIMRFVPGSTTLVEVVSAGGASGGIAVDADDNVYYAYQAPDFINGQIWRFSDAQVQSGNLTAVDAHIVNNVKAGYLTFDIHGDLYATRSHLSSVERFNPVSGESLGVVGYDPHNDWQIGKIAYNSADFRVYALYTDWTAYYSDLYSIALPPVCTVSEMTIDFGDVLLDTTNTHSLYLNNRGGEILEGNISVAPGAPFGIAGANSFSLSPVQTSAYTCSFIPETDGVFTGTVSFTSNGGDITVTLTGSAIPEPGMIMCILFMVLCGVFRNAIKV